MNTLLQDLRYGLRMLRKNPGFTVVAVLTLALGIGANTAIFSVIDGVIIRSLPYREPNRLVMVFETEPQLPHAPVTGPDFLDWREQSDVFERLAAGTEDSAELTGVDDPERLAVTPVSAGFFEMLGVRPAQGRTFRQGEDQPGHNLVAILTHQLWQQKFRADPNIVGKKATLDGYLFEIVGVLPKSFQFPRLWGFHPSLFIPLGLARNEQMRGSHMLWVMARLKPNVNIEQVQAQMEIIARRLEQQHPDTNKSIGARVVPLREHYTRNIRPVLFRLFAVVGFVLLIACVNVANLMLTRAIGREREIAIRASLGARRTQLVRQLLTESVLLALIGGSAGVLFAFWVKDALIALSPKDYIPQAGNVQVSGLVLGFTLVLSLVTGTILGLIPAWQVSRMPLNEALKEGTRTGGSGAKGRRLGSVLVTLEIALSCILLVGAGLMMRSFHRLMSVDIGIQPENVLTMRFGLPKSRYPRDEQDIVFVNRLTEKVRVLPGVKSVAATNKLPLMGWINGWIVIDGHPNPNPKKEPLVEFSLITPGYFQVMAIPQIQGRQFTEADSAQAPRVVIVNQTLVRHFFPNEDPIGKRISHDRSPSKPEWWEVVGVVGDARQGLDKPARPEAYFPYGQQAISDMVLTVRSSADPTQLIHPIREQFKEMDKDLPVYAVETMTQIISKSASISRFHTVLMSVFAFLAMVLAAIGLYGVMAYHTNRRTHEIGVRMAMGARRGDIIALIIKQGIPAILAGITTGALGAVGLARFLSSMLFEVKPTDPITLLVTTVSLTAVAFLAAWIPARRATRVDPNVALRYE